MLKEIIIAIQAYAAAYKLIQQHRLWKWIIVPGVVYALLFAAGMYFFWHSANDAVSWVSRNIGVEGWLRRQRSGLLTFLFMMSELMLRLVLLLFYFSLFKYFSLLLGAGIFAYLSEKTEAMANGDPTGPTGKQWMKDAARGMQVALRNAAWQTVYLIALLLLALVPVAGWIAPLIALFVECYYYGISMLDYSCARAQLPRAQSMRFISHHKGLAIGNGLIFYMMHLVPVAGWVLAPACAIIAATLSLHKIKNR